ncbi:MAG: poly(ethylene terephthalate) hydrolase family protein [Pirellulales bacterium]
MNARYLLILFSSIALLTGCGEPAPVTIPPATSLEQLSPGTHKLEVDFGSQKLKYTLRISENYDGSSSVPLALVLHYGYDGSRPEAYTGGDMMDSFESALAELDGIAIAPDVLGGDWTSTQNEQAAVWLTQSVMKSYNIDSQRVVVTGYSMGGEGTWFIGSRHQDLFTAAIPVAAPVAGSNTGWKIPAYVIHSKDDAVVSYASAKSHADAIKSNGGQLEFTTAENLTHYDTNQYDNYVRNAVLWLKENWK